METRNIYYTLKKASLYLSVTLYQDNGEPWTKFINHAMFYDRLDMAEAAHKHMGGEIIQVKIEEVAEPAIHVKLGVNGEICECRKGWG